MKSPANTNISIETIIDFLRRLAKDKSKVINILILIVAVMASSRVHSAQTNINRKLKRQINRESEKIELLKQMNTTEGKLKTYKERLSRKEIALIIAALNRLMQEAGLEVSSVTPIPSKKSDAYTKTTIRLSIVADDYHKIGKFISRLESSRDLYKVEMLNILLDKGRRSRLNEKKEKEPIRLSVELVVSRIEYKG